jgi:nucleoside-diphosphate kinase
MIERTLILIKPDGVQRCLVGKILTRFEDSGLKIIGMKMVWADEEYAKKHYTEDITIRRGERVRTSMIDYIQIGPIIAIAIEGVNAIENVRKMVGATEPKSALPGTIRGDFSHTSFSYCDEKKQAAKNLIHASSDKGDAEREIAIWFAKHELHSYKTVHDIHIL